MSVLLHAAICVAKPFEVMSFTAVGKLCVSGTFKIAQGTFHHFPVYIARIFKESRKDRDCKSDVRASGNSGIHKTADGLAIRDMFHLCNFFGARRQIFLGIGCPRGDRAPIGLHIVE
jgi:hypothetical protein